MATKVIVSLPNDVEYDVRIGAGVLGDLGKSMAGVPALSSVRRVLVITDSNIGPLYLAKAKASLAAAGFKVSDVTVPAGEDSKSVEVASEIWSAMAQLELGRDCAVVALGGGVVGDLAGFVAATYMRGVPVVQVPTTLLSMVDSSVGGKTAINLPEGKNLVGAFFQPSFVCADTDVLSTLDEREWQCGCGEIVKSAVIDSDDFFFWLLENASALAARDEEVVAQVIARCIVFKAGIVAQDENERAGVRACLNYGHTLGHAIEACAGYGTFSHGAAVAEGVRFALRVAVEELDAQLEFVEAVEGLLDEIGLKKLEWRAPTEDLLSAMKHDKKVRGGQISFILASDVGVWQSVQLPDQTVSRYLDRWNAAKE